MCQGIRFLDDHFVDEPSIVDSSEVTPHMELSNPIDKESSLDLAPTPPVSPLSSRFVILHSSSDPPKSTFFCGV